MKEIWKNIKGYEKLYQISNYGRVKSKDRVVYNSGLNGKNKYCMLKQKDLKLYTTKKGYYLTWLYKNGQRKGLQVHRLVLQNFKPHKNQTNLQCNHIDCNKKNNFVDNLEWVTCKENIKHAIKNNLHVNPEKRFGSDIGSSKLNNEQVKEIRKIAKETNLPQHKIGKIYGVSQSVISNIINRVTWNHTD